MPIANIANKTFPFSTVVGMIVGATSSLKNMLITRSCNWEIIKFHPFLKLKNHPLSFK